MRMFSLLRTCIAAGSPGGSFLCPLPLDRRCAIRRHYRPLCVWTGDRPGYESKAAGCEKRSRKMWKWLESGGGSACAWDLGCFPLLLSLEIFTSRRSELCLSETVGLSWFTFTNRFAGVIRQVCGHLSRGGLTFTLWYFFTKCGKTWPLRICLL